MKVSFRTDASLKIGAGHVMRCLALAQALTSRGHRCKFICRDLQGHMGARVQAAGYELTLLPAPDEPFSPSTAMPAHAAWAEVDWSTDAKETRAAAEGADWLVMDHYAFDSNWQIAARPVGAKLMAVDDLADRTHSIDLLVDQNLGRVAKDYDHLLPNGAERLIGPGYALLRPEFFAARATAIARRADRGYLLAHVLVSMGGIDAANATGAVLRVLARFQGLRVSVVMGSSAPALEKVRHLASLLTPPADVHVDVADMASLMTDADIAIGAAGGTALERCVLGLPTLIAVVADNQEPSARALETCGAAIGLGRVESSAFEGKLRAGLTILHDAKTLCEMSARAASLVEGTGALRVARAMENPLTLRQAVLADAEEIWNWRVALPALYMQAGATPSLGQHMDWFANALNDPDRLLFVAGDPACAHLRLDLDGAKARVSILLAPDVRGRGFGARLLGMLECQARARGLTQLDAQVHAENAPSLALFRTCGYAECGALNGFYSFQRFL